MAGVYDPLPKPERNHDEPTRRECLRPPVKSRSAGGTGGIWYVKVARNVFVVPRRVRDKVAEIFGADLRSLAALRIVLALLVLADLSRRVADLAAHYSDAGVLPRTVLLQDVLSRWAFSLSVMNGEIWFQEMLFGVTAVAALALLLGYRTRLMTVVVWVLLLSIQWRNPLVGGAGDTLLRMLLFWGMFLPLGARWSLDRALGAVSQRPSTRYLSLGTVALFLQIAFVYWFTVIQKSGDEWRVDGTALYYALSIDQIVTPIGSYLLDFPDLLWALTFATILLEAVGPFLLFSPFFTGPVRTATVLVFMGFHSGIWLTMDIGIFPWTSAFCMVCFLPTWFWDRAAATLHATFPERPGVVRRLQRRATGLTDAYWRPLRERPSYAEDTNVPSTGDDTARGLVNSDAPDAPEKRQEDVGVEDGTTVEDGVQSDGGLGTEPATLRAPAVTNLLALFFLVYVFLWNLSTVSAFAMPERALPLGPFLGLSQSWNMFVPYPAKNDGWYVLPGTLRDGRRVDLMPAATRNDFRRGEDVSWRKPRNVADSLGGEHWRKYLERIRDEEFSDQRLYFGAYVCRGWNARHDGPEHLSELQIVFMKETTQPGYQRPEPEMTVLAEIRCS